jgi:hypothetical protein
VKLLSRVPAGRLASCEVPESKTPAPAPEEFRRGFWRFSAK